MKKERLGISIMVALGIVIFGSLGYFYYIASMAVKYEEEICETKNNIMISGEQRIEVYDKFKQELKEFYRGNERNKIKVIKEIQSIAEKDKKNSKKINKKRIVVIKRSSKANSKKMYADYLKEYYRQTEKISNEAKEYNKRVSKYNTLCRKNLFILKLLGYNIKEF